MHSASNPPTPLISERLARLSPQQRDLLLRQLAKRSENITEASDSNIVGRALPDTAIALSAAQQRIWFFERLQPGTGAYHVYGYYRLHGFLNVPALHSAFDKVVQRHAALRTSFTEMEGDPKQIFTASATLRINDVDLRALPAIEREAALQKIIDTETEKPFDLSCAPLLRVGLIRIDQNEHVLLVIMHHIISDAWSTSVLFRDLAEYYQGFVDGKVFADDIDLSVQFPDAVLWQNEPKQQDRIKQQLQFWREALSGASGLLDLPTDYPRSSTITARGGRQLLQLPQALVSDITALARQEGATLFMALLAAFQILLARYSGQEDIIVGSPVANRATAEFEPLIGLLVNTLALRGDLSGDPSFRQLLARTRSHCLEALDNAEVPLERIIDSLDMERSPGRTPLFQTMFVLQNTSMGTPSVLGLEAEWIEPIVHTARFELTLSIGDTSSGMAGVLDYNLDLFEPATAARMAHQFGILLRNVISHPDLPLSQITLIDDEQKNDLLKLGDGGATKTVADSSLFDLFKTQAARTPDRIALVEPGRQLSYTELLALVNGLAIKLLDLKLASQSNIAILTDRSIDSIVCVLAVLAAGAAYVPLDPSHPDNRLDFILTDASIAVLLTPPSLIEHAKKIGHHVFVISTDSIIASDKNPAIKIQGNQAAYIIYTSGSTGTPKGVVVEHRAAVNLVTGFMDRHDFNDQRLLMIPPLIFDASVGDVFPVLASGSTLVLHPTPTELSPRALERFCQDYAITAIDAPAALWRRWAEAWLSRPHLETLLPALKLMMIGGESVPLELVRRFSKATGNRVALCNHYGPTEASVCAAMLTTHDGSELRNTELPIGKPLAGVKLYVLDQNLMLMPRGIVGELYIGGEGVAREYFGQANLTRDSFIHDPHTEKADARMYRTGDLVRWNADGNMQFLGRRDHQIKFRGFRIELSEIEAALSTHPKLQAAVAMLREDRPGDKRLVAYVVSADHVSSKELREYLAQQLPEAMLPSIIVALASFPLTNNGKINRNALPAPADVAQEKRSLCIPANDTERKVLAVWQEVLGRNDLSTDDDFFAAGGDSLMTLPLVFKLHAALGVELPLASVFANPSVITMARAIDALLAGAETEALDLKSKVHLSDDIDPGKAQASTTSRDAPNAILLTGATGYLGAYLLRELLDNTSAKIFCLVRAENNGDGISRIRANLESYSLWRSNDQNRLLPVLGDLSSTKLGVSDEQFSLLAESVDVIFHNGGQVNFLAPYDTLEAANVNGTREVLALATSVRVKPVHLVSTLGVYLTESNLDKTVRESDAPPLAEEQYGGYNQSKWVSEQLALLARERGLPVAIYRPARITGDSRSGISNLGDYFNAWIKGCLQLGLVPHLPEESFDMAPVDYVSRAIVKLALGAGDENGNFHFYNSRRLPITEAAKVMREAGLEFTEIDYQQWRTALINNASTSRDNALAPFAGLFPQQPDAREPKFDCSATENAIIPFDICCPAADRELFSTYIKFLLAKEFLPSPTGATA